MTTPPSRRHGGWQANQQGLCALGNVLRIYRQSDAPALRPRSGAIASWRPPGSVDEAMEQWGMAMGPMAVGDLAASTSVIGLASNYLMKKKDPASTTCSLIAWSKPVVGQKSGAGARYDPETRARQEDPVVAEIIKDTRASWASQAGRRGNRR